MPTQSPLSEMIIEELEKRHGGRPHAIIARLHRSKLDPNREVKEAAQGDPTAEAAWHRFHDSAQAACASGDEKARHGPAAGHSRPPPSSTKGSNWAIWSKQSMLKANRCRAECEMPALIASTSICDLDKRSPQSFAELLRGPQSLGGLLELRGFRCLPSPSKVKPRHPGRLLQRRV
jgi:hypothetical protein